MNLKEYISEAISSGKHGKYIQIPDPKRCTIDDVVSWLESLGVQGKRYGYTGKQDEDSPPVRRGELVYYVGPCQALSTYWIALYNNVWGNGTEWSQEACVWIDSRERVGRFSTQDRTPIDTTVEKELKIMLQMVEDPNKLIKI